MKLNYILISVIILFATGCDLTTKDRYLSSNLKEDTLKTIASPVNDETDTTNYEQKRIPHIQIPEELKQPTTLTLNEGMSVKYVLSEIARKLDLNFQMTTDVHPNAIFYARKRPFIEVLDAVCDIADLRYTISGNMVKVEKDLPYSNSYDVQFLNLSRDSENKISIATEIDSSSSEKNDKQGASDSNVVVTTKSDFWSEMDDGLKIILKSAQCENAKYSINKQSGIITVYANSKTHRNVAEYIDKVKASTKSQVLIEAKIIEVSLKNEYRRGINWGLLSGRFKLSSALADNSANGLNNVGTHGTPVSFAYNKNNMSSIISALEEFGSTRTISNPRITAMNNQAAVLKVAQNHVYFRLNYDKTYGSVYSDRTDISVSSDIKTIPIGLVMFVQPSIDIESNTITLFLRPTITKLSDTVNDPAVDIAMRAASNQSSSTQQVQYEQSRVPVTEVREVASILKLNDGEIAVLGGFMEARSAKNRSGLPGFKDVPVVGEIASSNGMGDEIVELVILIKVKLANVPQMQRAADIRLQRFVPDPRPF